jgi:hypothetical protein
MDSIGKKQAWQCRSETTRTDFSDEAQRDSTIPSKRNAFHAGSDEAPSRAMRWSSEVRNTIRNGLGDDMVLLFTEDLGSPAPIGGPTVGHHGERGAFLRARERLRQVWEQSCR